MIENRNATDIFVSPVFRKLLSAGGASFLITLINPFGWRLWEISVGYASNKYFSDRISEWRSVDFQSPGAWPFLLLMTVTLMLALRTGKRQPLGETFLIVGFTALGAYSLRSIPPAAIVIVPLIGEHFVLYFERITRLVQVNGRIETLEQNLRGILWPVVSVMASTILLLSGVKLDAAQKGYHFNSREFPVEAVDWLEKNPQQGHMFNWFRWGGYLIYRLWPDQLVFMDGQTEFFGETLTRQHDQILEAQDGWEEVVEEYNITWMIVPVDSRIALLFRDSTEWKTIYKDEVAVILRKQP